ncbi:MAG: methyltransferase domain-containing protein [Patescibacteria group bacterium]
MLLAEQIYTKAGRVIQFEPTKKVINLGCGNQKYPGVLGLDALSNSAADIVHDLNKFPWPIDESNLNVVLCFQTLEHLEDLPRVMEELYRICKNGARIVIEVPYFRSVGAFADPTHRHFFTTKTMDYFCVNRSRDTFGYSKASLLLIDFWVGWPTSRNIFMHFFKTFIKKYHIFYDKYVSLLFPAPILVFELEVQKR